MSSKTKRYWVEVRSSTSAKMRVEATSMKEAYEKADKEMAASMKRMLKTAYPRPDIKDLDGYGEAMKTGIEIIK